MMRFKNSQGLTLIEMMVTLAILATLTVLSNQAIQKAIFTKIKLQRQIDDNSQARDALKIIQRDVNLAFHYRDIEKEMKLAVMKSNPQANNNAGGIAPLPGQDALKMAEPNRVDPTTNFVGDEKNMYFATMAMDRYIENSQQADFVKVGYSIKSCHKPNQEGLSKNCLIRTESAVVEGDITKGGTDTILIDDIDEFKLRYLGKAKQDWVSSWNSVNGDADIKNRYPDAIEVSLVINRGGGKDKSKKISMQLVIPVHFTNNDTDAGQTGATGGT